jgi:hypothetical protein
VATSRYRTLGRLSVAVVAVLLSLLLKLALDPLIEEESPFLLFFGAVMVSALAGGFKNGLLATALAALTADYFFLAPIGTLRTASSGQLLRLCLFMLEGGLISALTSALQTARRRAEHTAERIARLEAVSAALVEALTPAEVATVVVEQGVAALEAHAGVIVRRADDATLEVIGAQGYPAAALDPWRRFPLAAPIPLAEAVRTAAPIWIESRAALEAGYPAVAASPTSNQSFAALPLVVEGQVIGAFGLSFATARTFTADDRSYITALSQQCAQALERARLFEAEHVARTNAEAAVRLRDVFLSVASHELRTPLTGLQGNVQLLQRRAARDGTFAERDRRAVDVIVEQTKRLGTLISTLLDVSRIQHGQLQITRDHLDLGALLRRVVDEVVPTLTHHSIRLAMPEEPLIVDGDTLRLEQVVHNLLSNAVKYSPFGGEMCVQATRQEADACVVVTDQGLGIPKDALSQIFDRFFRASNAAQQNISGVGIGLFVVREIVTLHGGTVQAESTTGQGSTFTVRLPLAPAAVDGPQARRVLPMTGDSRYPPP